MVTNNNSIYSIFSVYGIELEYMIVSKNTLNVMPISDKILGSLAGHIINEVSCGEIAISNEFVLHVIEFKTNGPKPNLAPLAKQFSEQINKINKILESFDAELMPTGMHPWYNPKMGMKLWPHGDRGIYEAYNNIFNCTGHGWGNVQSTQINLPFSNEIEFIKLHNAIRLILPIIPALAASTPFIEGQISGVMDTRLLYYGKNQIKIPSISGKIIPEFISSIDEYHQTILQPMYKDISVFDKNKILQYEWLNSRGAIAHFERGAIEIRIMDVQECPLADLACLSAIIAVCKYIINNTEDYLIKPIKTDELCFQYNQAIKFGMKTNIHYDISTQMGIHNNKNLTANILWEKLIELSSIYLEKEYFPYIEKILSNGNLSERLLKAYNKKPDLLNLYKNLNNCLTQNILL